jgi:ABC-type glycerol-3-phosphate transport system substrate-binding protein
MLDGAVKAIFQEEAMKRRMLAVAMLALCAVLIVPAALWSWNNEGDYPAVFEKIIDRFQTAHPEAEVEIQWIPYTEYNEKMKATIAAGDYPEIPAIHPGSPQYSLSKAGELLPLNEALKTGFPKYFPSALVDLTFDGNITSIPLDVNNLTIFYNKNIFKALGLKIPQTIDELIALCKKLKAGGYMGIRRATYISRWWPTRTTRTRCCARPTSAS